MMASSKILTNQLLFDELDLWNQLDGKSISEDDAKEYYRLIDELLDSQINESIDWLDSEEAKDYFFNEAELQKEIFDALEDAWDEIFDSSYESVDDLLDTIYDHGKKQGYDRMRETIRYTDADIQAIRLAKDYNYHLIKNLTGDLHTTVKNHILQGIITGENPYNLAKTLQKAGVTPLKDSPFTARQRATMIAKTETSRMQNTGMLQSYVNEGYTEVKLLTAEDKYVCTTCLEYAYKFNKDEPRVYSPELLEREKVHNIIQLVRGGRFPPFHPHCRCTYLTVWKSKMDAPANPPIINLTPLSVKIKKTERELPEPTKDQLFKNLRPAEREKYENYKRNIPKQKEWLSNNPDASPEEIAKHQKRLDFLERKFLELKKKALGADAHPKPKKEKKVEKPKPKKEEPKSKGPVPLKLDGDYTEYTETLKNGSKLKVYEFKNGFTLGIAEGSPVTHEQVINHISSLPAELINQIKLKRINLYLDESTKGGYSDILKNIMLQYSSNESVSTILDNLTHELSHAFDYQQVEEINHAGLSLREVYDKIFIADNKLGMKYTNPETGEVFYPERFPTEYAKTSWHKFKKMHQEDMEAWNNRERDVPKPYDKRYSEDFAESSKLYLNPATHDKFVKEFPNRAKFLEGLYGEFKVDKKSQLYKALVSEGVLKESMPKINLNEKVSDLKKDLPLKESVLDEILKWSSKKVKNQNRYGYEFNPETGELTGKEIRGQRGVINFRDYYVDKTCNTIRTISNTEDQTFPSLTDLKHVRALSGSEHIVISDKELWYIHSTEKLDLHTVNHGQYEIDVVYKSAQIDALKEVQAARDKGTMDEKQLKDLYNKTFGDYLLKGFNTQEWLDRGFTIRRGIREDYKEPRKRKANKQPKSKQTKPTSELTYDNLKTPEDVAAFYGLDYKRGTDDKGRPTQKFTDHLTYTDNKTGKTINHDIEITFDAYFTKNTGAKKYIDSNNSGKCTYDLKEIIKIYKESPDIFKFATNEIIFINENKRRTLGYTRWDDKVVRVLPNSFKQNQTGRGNVRQTLYHEMSHCLDFSLTKKKYVDVLKNPSKYSRREWWEAREAINRREYGICSTKEWQDIVKKEEKWLSDNGHRVEHCSWYGDGWRKIDISENWAETGSMAAMDDLTDKSQATMQRQSGKFGYEMVYWDEWIKLHKITYEWAVKKWRSLKPTDFTYI